MKKIIQISIILFSLLSLSVHAQEQQGSLRERLARRQQQQSGQSQNSGVKIPQLSVRAEMMNENQTQDLSNATWVREVYRFLDLNKGKNAALLYPIQPIGKKMNLYTMMFKLLSDGNLVAYNWNNGQEEFDDSQIINFEDVLRNLEIPFQKNGEVYVYDEYSIPSNEALGYYLKEAWYFDQSNSVLGVKIVAICPVLFRQDFMGELDPESTINTASLRQPQFWIPYETIRPYAARMPIMTSDKNNVMNKTIDDYFRMRLYDGEIYKTTNMENKFLNQIYNTPEELEQGREKIENELQQFDKDLWVINDSINAIFNSDYDKKKAKAPKPQKAKSGSSSSGSGNATYSARDRR
ncbi:MAG: gliding motility protein GldN [Dysgonomonas sp.]|nr:gliding motility protein GldN [Dysgonomonas sp.]